MARALRVRGRAVRDRRGAQTRQRRQEPIRGRAALRPLEGLAEHTLQPPRL